MTTIVPSHSTVAPCSQQLDFRRVVVLQQPPANPNPVTDPLMHFNASLSCRLMRLRRFYCMWITEQSREPLLQCYYIRFTDMLLAVSGMYQLEKKEEGLHPSLRHPGRPPPEPEQFNELNPPSKRRCLPTPLSS